MGKPQVARLTVLQSRAEVARGAHNAQVAGSNPASATNGPLAQPVEAAALEAVRSGFDSLEGYHIRRLGPNGRGTGFKLRSVMVRIHQAAPIRIVSLRGRQAVLKTVMTPKGWGFDSSAIRQFLPLSGGPSTGTLLECSPGRATRSPDGLPERGKWS